MRKVLLAVLLVLSSHATGITQTKSPSDRAFERLKRLVGTWDAIEKGTSETSQPSTR
jgi:hypothetical protein